MVGTSVALVPVWGTIIMPPCQRPASATKDAELETLLKVLGDNFNVRTAPVLGTAPAVLVCRQGSDGCRCAWQHTADALAHAIINMQDIFSAFCMQAAALLDQGYADSEDGASSTLVSRAAADTRQASNNLVRRASKALLKQVEETRRKYTVEVEGLKAEIQLLTKQANRDRRDAELASVTAAAAKKAALDATEELERLNAEVQRSKRALQQLNRCAASSAWCVVASCRVGLSCMRWCSAGSCETWPSSCCSRKAEMLSARLQVNYYNSTQ